MLCIPVSLELLKSKALAEILTVSKLCIASDVQLNIQMHFLDVRFQAKAGHCCRALKFPIPTVSTTNMMSSKIVHTDCAQQFARLLD